MTQTALSPPKEITYKIVESAGHFCCSLATEDGSMLPRRDESGGRRIGADVQGAGIWV